MEPTLSLFELNNLVRSVVEQTVSDEYWLQAELAEARLASNGHFYVEFVEKDASGKAFIARARGTIWSRTYNMLSPLFERATGERLRAGMTVRVCVTVTFHELYGYSLNVIDIDPTYTLGAMARRRREILSKLEKDGILHDNQQLPLPALLQRIAVVSSSTAAGYGDFCHQLESNEYGLRFDVQLFPAVMQGANVEDSVLAALEAIMSEADSWDCVVIIRGGGATSDLSDFDSYPLAAAVAQMPLPVIVGIGHERDETVLDSVAHTRVKTPTAAAAFLIAHGAAQLARLEELRHTIEQHAKTRIIQAKAQVERCFAGLRAFAFSCQLQQRRLEGLMVRLASAPGQQLEAARHRLERSTTHITTTLLRQTEQARFRLQLMQQRFEALDPQRQLQRGYSLTLDQHGNIVRSIKQVKEGQTVVTRLADGTLTTVVTELQAK